jgi:predicted RNA-binding protein
MCEINAYLQHEGKEELLLELVDRVEAGEGMVRVANMFGEEKVVSGSIHRFSLREGKIVLREGS